MKRCPKCPVSNDFGGLIVFGSGPSNAKMMLVGEAPGKEESFTGQPFVGASGQLLTKIMAHAGVPRSDVFITNTLQCRPPENRDPLKEELESCVGNLYTKISIIRPRLIVALGRFSARVLTGSAGDVKVLRKLDLSYQGIPVVVTMHPAGLIYDVRRKRDAWEDWNKIAKLYRELCLPVQKETQA